MKNRFVAAFAALTFLSLGQAQAEEPVTSLQSIMDQALSLGEGQTTVPEPTEPVVTRPTVVTPVTSASQVLLSPADPSSDPLGAQLDMLILEAQNIHPRLEALETKVDSAIVEVRTMRGVQEQSLARLDEFEERQVANTARVMQVRAEADQATQHIASLEQKLTVSEGTVRQMHGQVAQANQTANSAMREAQRANAHLNRPRLSNLFGLLGTR